MKTHSLKLSMFILLVAVACGPKSNIDENAFENSLDSLNKTTAVIDDAVVTSILDQIPSPLEISMLLKQSGSKYNEAILNSPDKLSLYNTNYKKALNLGIYGADLGYTNIYEKNMDGIKYLSTIKSLANDLNIGQFFDIASISRLATNSNNIDSLLLITTQNFNSINQYLQTQNRANLSALILVGGWIEAMQIMCDVASHDPKNKELLEKIGEQKIIQEQIALLLSFYKDDPQLSALHGNFEEVKKAFESIKIVYTYKESTMEVVNGVAVIKDNSTTTIDITEQDASNIKNAINSIRTSIVN